MITKEWIAQKIMNAAARVSLLARSNGRWFEVEGRGQSVGEPSYEDTVSHYQHYGFRSRPRKRAELITVPLMGAESQRVAVASEAGPNRLPARLLTSMYLGDRWEYLFESGEQRLRDRQLLCHPAIFLQYQQQLLLESL